MSRLKPLSILVIAMVLLIGCRKDDNPPNMDKVLDALTVSVRGGSGILRAGSVPFSNTSLFPSIISFPDIVRTTRSSTERIDLIFEIESSIAEIYFTIIGASKYYVFEYEGNFTGGDTEAIRISLDIPSDLEDGNFTASIGVKDEDESLSDLVEVAFSIGEGNEENRTIYFADYSSNSTLSTLNFDTGEVEDIGYTGYGLTDIAFLGDALYGVTMSSELIALDLSTGAGTQVGNIGMYGVNALEGNNANLYGATIYGQFVSIDPITAQGTEIELFGSNAVSSGDLVFDANNEFLYGTLVVPGSSSDQLAIINPATGEAVFVGETGYSEVWGLAYLRNQLLGLTTEGEFIIIDPETGKGTFVENTEAFSAGGAAAVRK